MGKSANGRSSVGKVFFFATALCCGHWLTCFVRKGYSHWRLLFCKIILPEIRTERPEACNLIKKETLHRCFPVNFAKFLRTHFLTEHLRWLLLRARKFVSVTRLCTLHNTSNSLANSQLRIPFLQISSQWLLPVAAFKCQLFFLKREKQKQFFIPPLTLICFKSCNCIKIIRGILFIHDSEKTTRIDLSIFSM